MTITEWQKDKQHLRCEYGHGPQWLKRVFEEHAPLAFRNHVRRAGSSRHSLVDFCRKVGGSKLFDHVGTDLHDQLVTEPYCGPSIIRPYAEEFARQFDLEFSIERVSYWHQGTTRIVFWPKEGRS